jgi:N-acetylmuramoyl-L-alanine amidase
VIRRTILAALLVTLAASAYAQAPVAGPASGAPSGAVTLTGMRSWSSPTSTRIVLDFSSPITPVAPDSGLSNRVSVSIPVERVTLGPGVVASLPVRDSVVDSVAVTLASGAHIDFWFADTTRFRVFTLMAEEGKPFRLVVDVSRPGGTVAEDARLANIAAAKRRDRVRIVAVDAGHGGEDTGAHGPRGVLEKHVNLGVARALVNALNAGTGVKAVLTRDGDYFIPLRERYHIAERMKADMFISIHANSSRRRGSGSGTEVYFLSMRGASDQATQDLAESENAADLVGGVPSDAEDDLVSILYDVKRSSALQQSQLLAETLLDHLMADRRLEQRGVKQAGFAVLKSVEFPSVLVETAFINNPYEAKLLRDPQFQTQIGKQLATGVRAFLERAGMGVGPTVPSGAATGSQ